MSNARPRINPRRRRIDNQRLAAALLDLAADLDLDDDEIERGAQIYARLHSTGEKATPKGTPR